MYIEREFRQEFKNMFKSDYKQAFTTYLAYLSKYVWHVDISFGYKMIHHPVCFYDIFLKNQKLCCLCGRCSFCTFTYVCMAVNF